jgi:hypothetical protein
MTQLRQYKPENHNPYSIGYNATCGEVGETAVPLHALHRLRITRAAAPRAVVGHGRRLGLELGPQTEASPQRDWVRTA